MLEYSGRTEFYRIPVMAEGDMMTEEQEAAQMGAVDRLLYAALWGCVNTCLVEGVYALEWDEGRTECRLTVSPAEEGGYALMGVMDRRMWYARGTRTAGVYAPGETWHVYVEAAEGLDTDPEAWTLESYETAQAVGPGRMPLCVVDLTGAGAIVTDVPGKAHAGSWTGHVASSSDPHGSVLEQTDLAVSGRLTVGGSRVMPSEVLEDQVSAGAGSAIVVDCGTREPGWVDVAPADVSAGTVAWTVESSVSGGETSWSIRLVNSGSAGVALHVRVEWKA